MRSNPLSCLVGQGVAYGGVCRADPFMILLRRQLDAVGAAKRRCRVSGRGSMKLPYLIWKVPVWAGTFACRFRSYDLSARSRFCLSVSPNRILRPSLSPPSRCRCAGCFVVRCRCASGLHARRRKSVFPCSFPHVHAAARDASLRDGAVCGVSLPDGSIVHAESAGVGSNFYRTAALRRLRRR